MASPFGYQERGIDFLAPRDRGILADEQGLGKTIQAILAADRAGARTTLVIAPAISLTNWSREWSRWQTDPRSIQVIRTGRDAQNLWGDVVIVSYALATRLKDILRQRAYDLLIVDEAQALKTSTSARTRAVYGKAGLIGRCRRCWLLSGTITPNHAGELYPHHVALFGCRLTEDQYLDRYTTWVVTKYGRQITGSNLARQPELAAQLAPYLLMRKQRDVLPDLPPVLLSLVPVTLDTALKLPALTEQQRAIVDEFERTGQIDAAGAMHFSTLRRAIGTAKVSKIVELAQQDLESGVTKLVIFAVHLDVIAGIKQGLGPVAGVIQGSTPPHVRQDLIDRFQNADAPKILVIQTTTGGTAITLTAAHHALFGEVTWVPADTAQAISRLARIGQRSTVFARVVTLIKTIDERVNEVVARKARGISEFENLITHRSPACTA